MSGHSLTCFGMSALAGLQSESAIAGTGERSRLVLHKISEGNRDQITSSQKGCRNDSVFYTELLTPTNKNIKILGDEIMPNIDPLTLKHKDADAGISRRDMLVGMGAAAAMAYAGQATSAAPEHDHSKHSAQLPGLLDAVNDCVDKGQRCITHCLVSFKEGDLELADCAAKVHEMEAVCRAFSYLVTANSSYVKAYAGICEQVCKDCEKECLKHEEHVECKACADACSATVDQIHLSLK
jgi:Cys-rich four helix bundle protein (predicted Tat secretion target)